MIAPFYRFALGRPNLRVIFQNTADRDALPSLSGLPAASTVMIRGSGVELDRYRTCRSQPRL